MAEAMPATPSIEVNNFSRFYVSQSEHPLNHSFRRRDEWHNQPT